MSTPSPSAPAWTLRSLGLLLAVSIATNLIFVSRIYLPQWRQDWREWHAAPPVERPGDHVRGRGPVTVIEYSDFQCPYCANLNHSLAGLADAGQLRWVYRHYTGNSGHPEAKAAAVAAECAGEQGQFWQYADILTSTQAHLAPAIYDSIAAALRLDLPRFRACLASGKYQGEIARDEQEADDLAIIGTPTWFVEGKRHAGAPPEAVLQKIIVDARDAHDVRATTRPVP